MRKYRKGRVLVLSGMVGFASLTVLAGTSAADSGRVTVSPSASAVTPSGLTAKQAKELKKHNRFYTSCIDVTSTGFTSKSKKLDGDNLQATFELKGGGYDLVNGVKATGKDKKMSLDTTFLAGSPSDGTYNGTAQYDLASWLSQFSRKDGKVSKKGYHVEVRYGDRHRTIWVLNAIDCKGNGGGGNTGGDCVPNHITAALDPASFNETWGGGSHVGFTWDDSSTLDPASITVTVDDANASSTSTFSPAQAFDPVVANNSDGTATVTVMTPTNIPTAGTISFSSDQTDDGNPDTPLQCGYAELTIGSLGGNK